MWIRGPGLRVCCLCWGRLLQILMWVDIPPLSSLPFSTSWFVISFFLPWSHLFCCVFLLQWSYLTQVPFPFTTVMIDSNVLWSRKWRYTDSIVPKDDPIKATFIPLFVWIAFLIFPHFLYQYIFFWFFLAKEHGFLCILINWVSDSWWRWSIRYLLEQFTNGFQ